MAMPLTSGEYFTGYNEPTGDLYSPAGLCEGYDLYNVVWYKFYTYSATYVTIDNCVDSMAFSDYNGIAILLQGLECSAPLIDCSFEDCESLNSRPYLFTEIQPNSDYMLGIGGTSASEAGTFTYYFELHDPPSNNECSSATVLLGSGVIVDTAQYATLEEDISSLILCGNPMPIGAAVWYTFIAGKDDNHLIASLCTLKGGSTDSINTKLYLFTGTCESLICIASDEYSCGNNEPDIDTFIEPGPYYLVVNPLTNVALRPFTLYFELSSFEPYGNEECSSAEEITENTKLVYGSLVIASAEAFVSECGTYDAYPSVWYKFNSLSNNGLYISFCAPGAHFSGSEIYVTILKGNCVSPQCITYVTFSYFNCPTTDEINLHIQENMDYYIVVSGESPSAFAFQFIVDYRVVNSNTECSFPEEIYPANQVITGQTYSELINNGAVDVACPSFTFSANVWYRFSSGSFNKVVVSLCDNGGSASLPSRSQLYDSNCSTLSCLLFHEEFCTTGNTLSSFVVPESTYLISVYNTVLFSATDAEFTMYFSLSTENLLDNDVCSGSIQLTYGSHIDTYALLPSTYDITPIPCNTNAQSNDVWFYIDSGIHNHLTLSICDSAPNTSILLYQAPDCGGPFTCVNGYTPCAANQGNNYEVDILFNSRYYFVVQEIIPLHYPSTFSLSYSIDGISPTNDNCQSASLISLPSSIIDGYTYLSSQDSAFSGGMCDSISTAGNNVWYKFDSGEYNQVTLDLCDLGSADFDSKLFLFMGSSCFALQCVSGNDYACSTSQSYIQSLIYARQFYYIMITGASDGEFTLVFNAEQVTAPNDECVNALPLNRGINYGYNLLSTIDSIAPCQGALISNNVWYRFEAFESNYLQISTCASGTFGFDGTYADFTPVFHLFLGRCYFSYPFREVECISTTSTNCLGGSAIMSYIQPYNDYLLSISDATVGGAGGTFALYFDLITQPYTNDECTFSQYVDNNPILLFGTLDFMTSDTIVAACGASYGNVNVWYSFNSLTFNQLYLSLCTNGGFIENTMGIHSVHVFEGACASPSPRCVHGVDLDCDLYESLYIQVNTNTDYLISVSGDSGTFALYFELSFSSPPQNDVCPGTRIDTASVSAGILGGLMGAAIQDGLNCGSETSTLANVWYSFYSRIYNLLDLDVCTQPQGVDFPMVMYLYKGTCTENQCVNVDLQNASCGFGFYATALLQTENEYLLSVGSSTPQIGRFSFMYSFSVLEIPSNDECVDALPVILPDYAEMGSMVFAGYDSSIEACTGPSPTYGYVWYTFNSGGDNIVNITVCYSSPIEIYLFSGDCSSLECLDSPYRIQSAPPPENCSGSSLISYLLLNTPYRFALGIWDGSVDGSYDLYVNTSRSNLPFNDLCEAPGSISSLSSNYFGTTIYASTDITEGVSCGGYLVTASMGNVWYTFFSPIHNHLFASLCDSNSFSDFNSNIQLYIGEQCNSLSCVTRNDTSCATNASEISTYLKLNTNYYLSISSIDGIGGYYNLYVLLSTIAPPNDDCINATAIQSPFIYLNGYTELSSFDSIPNGLHCPSFTSSENVWYSFSSESQNHILISLCEGGSNYNFDMALHLYQGSCASSDCIADNPYGECQLPEIKQYIAESEDYLLSVSSINQGEYGTFTLYFLLSAIAASNNDCSSPMILDNTNQTVNGRTSYATTDGLPCGSDRISINIWYTFSSSLFNYVKISFCESDGGYVFTSNLRFALIMGTCNDYQCVAISWDGSGPDCNGIPNRIIMNTMLLQTSYLLSVGAGIEEDFGYFAFTINFFQNQPENDECGSALSFPSQNTQGTIIGYTIGSHLNTIDTLNFLCADGSNEYNGVYDVWYTLQSALFNHISLSLCRTSPFPAGFIYLFQGGNGACDEPHCLLGDNAQCISYKMDEFNVFASGFGGIVEGYMAFNSNYYVSVSTNTPSTFLLDYTLTMVPPFNDDCLLATNIEVESSNVYGYLAYATIDFLPPADGVCGSNLGSKTGSNVWYQFSSSLNNHLQIHFCGADNFISFDGSIFLFEGNNSLCLEADPSLYCIEYASSSNSSSLIVCPITGMELPHLSIDIRLYTDYLFTILNNDNTPPSSLYEFNFSFLVSIQAPENDACIHATVLEVDEFGESYIKGDSIYSMIVDNTIGSILPPLCVFESYNDGIEGTVWYRIYSDMYNFLHISSLATDCYSTFNNFPSRVNLYYTNNEDSGAFTMCNDIRECMEKYHHVRMQWIFSL